MKKILEYKIEQYRTEMHELASRSSFQSPEVIRASVLLDEMLNKYDKLIKNKK